jgi:hypothetical protein
LRGVSKDGRTCARGCPSRLAEEGEHLRMTFPARRSTWCCVADPGGVATGGSFPDCIGCAILADSRLRMRVIAVSTMISEVYDAFIAAGAPEEKARKAAEALADHENRFSRIDAELIVLKWMVGFAIALNVAILTRSFFH